MRTATYYGVTATGQTQWYDRSGNQRIGMAWYIVSGPAANRGEAEAQGREAIGDLRTAYGTDIYKETAHKNFRVVPKSKLSEYRLSPEDAYEISY